VILSFLALPACDDPPTTTAPPPPPPTSRPSATASASASAAAEVLPKLLFFPPMETPEDNPLTKERIDLGKILFFDKRLGKEGQMSCESCHFEDKGWADALPTSKKADGVMNTRHTPALHNVGYNKAWYWDGRAPTLEAQVMAAWKGQMGGEPDKVVGDLAKIPEYEKRFNAAFGKEEITPDDVVKALAAFVRTIRSGNAPYDKWEQDKKSGAMSESAQRGFELFRNKAGCSACHAPPLFTDFEYHNVGIGFGKPVASEGSGGPTPAPVGSGGPTPPPVGSGGPTPPDPGRGKVSDKDEDNGKFKTPSLRSVTLHPPYFHDGSAKTIEEALDYMLSGGHANPTLDEQLKKVELTGEERADLLEFIKALEGEKQSFEPPKIP
jgi:cytochrome c peroxidase